MLQLRSPSNTNTYLAKHIHCLSKTTNCNCSFFAYGGLLERS
nr:MAG TPA: hypothetical protein [Caudoviricetes sp.]